MNLLSRLFGRQLAGNSVTRVRMDLHRTSRLYGANMAAVMAGGSEDDFVQVQGHGGAHAVAIMAFNARLLAQRGATPREIDQYITGCLTVAERAMRDGAWKGVMETANDRLKAGY